MLTKAAPEPILWLSPKLEDGYRRPAQRHKKELQVAFEKSGPEIIGTGGENAILPVKDVAMGYRHARNPPRPRVPQKPFRLLELPGEVRSAIYQATLPNPLWTQRLICWNSEGNDTTRTDLYVDCVQQKRTYVNLTLVSREVRRESLYVLYSYGRFVIPAYIQTHKWGGLTPKFLTLAAKHKDLARQVRNIGIEINSMEARIRYARETVTDILWIRHYLPLFTDLQSVVVEWTDFVQPPLGVTFSNKVRPAIGIESRLTILRPLQEFQWCYPKISILINGMPFTRESSAPELKSEVTKGDIGKREGLFRIDGCLEELENEMRCRDKQREG